MNVEVPIWKKFTLTVDEAAAYFRIGQNKLRQIISMDRDADYLLWNGVRPQIKRRQFEQYVDGLSAI
mgnify:CR=1 FL=1